MSHVVFFSSFTRLRIISDTLDMGNLGVRVFFVLSGFLITGLLLQEEERSGTIRLGRFYLRRTFRIFPAYYVFVATVLIAARLHVVRIDPGDATAALTYTMNFHVGHHRTWQLGHGWSLAMEEQFYLVWPALLLLTGRRRAFGLAVLLIAVLPIVRFVEQQHGLVPGPPRSWESFGDALAIGGLLAGFGERLWNWRPYRAVLTSPAVALLPVLVLLATADLGGRPRLHAAVQLSVLNVLIALVIHYCVKVPTSPAARLLNWRPIAAVGVLSYSLYLWQEPFMETPLNTWWTRFPINVILAVIAAWLSYHLVEQPFLRIRQRIDTRINASRSADDNRASVPAIPASPLAGN